MNNLKYLAISAFAASASLVYAAGDLADGVKDGSIWQKDRATVCSTDFVGIRYMPVDNHCIRLTPRMSITSSDYCARTVKKIDLKNSKLGLGELKFGETLVYWDEENKTKRIEALIYNRGDDDERGRGEFNEIVRNAVRQLINLTKGQSGLESDISEADLEHVGVEGMKQWYWKWNSGAILLEASASTQEDGSFKAEFVRLKMGKDDSAIATGGADNISKKSLLRKNVQDDPKTRDRWIAGIPMVDQGTKGYCVPATTARVFAYYGMDAVDMNAMAQMFDASASCGTSLSKMMNELEKISDKFNYEVETLMICDGSRSAKNDWYKTVRKSIDDGVPILWCVQLGKAEEAGIPPGYGGSHMRLIIGYNKRNRSIIFSDSWGEGHEFKFNKLENAYKMSDSLHIITPKK